MTRKTSKKEVKDGGKAKRSGRSKQKKSGCETKLLTGLKIIVKDQGRKIKMMAEPSVVVNGLMMTQEDPSKKVGPKR
jgi:hypothetical protein